MDYTLKFQKRLPLLKGLHTMDKRITQLLALAVTAPSGDNCQPWNFTIENNALHIHNLPQKDASLYNYEQRASLIAHGALLENLTIAAPALGLEAEIRMFPDSADPEWVATVLFTEREPFEDPLFFWIERRCTNRKKYNDTPLTKSQKETLAQVVEGNSGVQWRLVTDPDKIRILANILANSDRLVFENRYLHQFLFEQIRWNDEEAKRTRDGLDIKTLELSPADRLAFNIFKYWPAVEILNRVGLSKLVAQKGKGLIGTSAGIAAMTLEDFSIESSVRTGRIMQRFWLQAASLGLSVQPIIGLALLIQRIHSGINEGLDDSQRQLVTSIADQLDDVFEFSGKPPVLIFRLGTGATPSARSLRLPISVE